MKGATLQEIARKCGVSHVTVWRALRNDPKVRPATGALIRACAAEMGYVPKDELRKGLAQKLLGPRDGAGRSVLIPYNEEALISYRSVDSFWEFVAGITEGAMASDTRVILAGYPNDREELSKIQDYLKEGVNGVIDFNLNRQTLALLKELKIPKVAHYDVNYGHQIEGASVGCDEMVGYRLAWEHLLAMGHQRVAFVSDARSPFGKKRSILCRMAGQLVSEQAVFQAVVPLVLESFQTIMEGLKDAFGSKKPARWPTLLFCSNDYVAQRISMAVTRHGMRVPDDISLIACDHSSLAESMIPELTAIVKPRREMGRAMLHLLDQIIDGVPGSDRVQQVLPTSLKIGESVAELSAVRS